MQHANVPIELICSKNLPRLIITHARTACFYICAVAVSLWANWNM